jgi:hypothetical protein
MASEDDDDPDDDVRGPRDYVTPHHLDWIERFKALVARAVKLAEPAAILPPARLPIPPPPLERVTRTGPGSRIKLGEPGWVWPMERHRTDNRPPVISDGRHAVGDMRFRGGKGHRGVDIMFRKRVTTPRGKENTLNHPWESRGFEVPDKHHALAAGPGKVITARWRSSGFVTAIDHGFGVTTAYVHLAALLVSVGDELGAGEAVGIVGAPPPTKKGGRPGLVHLHFDLLIGGKYVDPEPYLKTWPAAGRVVRYTGEPVA